MTSISQSPPMTFLKVGQPVSLQRCSDVSCMCGGKLWHCPYCDMSRFRPAHQNNVELHLDEMHWPYSMRLKDLLIIKCYHRCPPYDVPENNIGHFHCPLCEFCSCKRLSYARHIRAHLIDQGEGTQIGTLLCTPTVNQQPDAVVLNGKRYTLCMQSNLADGSNDAMHAQIPHYHCPECGAAEVSIKLFIQHLRGLAGKNMHREGEAGGSKCQARLMELTQLRETMTPSSKAKPAKDDPKIPISVVTKLTDLIPIACHAKGCCQYQYHCPLCTMDGFMPRCLRATEKHLKDFHWRGRMVYQGRSMLKCLKQCGKRSKALNLPPVLHYHCVACAQSKTPDELPLHISKCRGKRLQFLQQQTPSSDIPDQSLSFVTSTAVPSEPSLVMDDEDHDNNDEGDVDDHKDGTVDGTNEAPCLETGLSEMDVLHDDPPSDPPEEPDLSTDIEVFDKFTGSVSKKFMQCLSEHGDDARNILEQVSQETNVTVIWSPGTNPCDPACCLTGGFTQMLRAQAILQEKLDQYNGSKIIKEEVINEPESSSSDNVPQPDIAETVVNDKVSDTNGNKDKSVQSDDERDERISKPRTKKQAIQKKTAKKNRVSETDITPMVESVPETKRYATRGKRISFREMLGIKDSASKGNVVKSEPDIDPNKLVATTAGKKRKHSLKPESAGKLEHREVLVNSLHTSKLSKNPVVATKFTKTKLMEPRNDEDEAIDSASDQDNDSDLDYIDLSPGFISIAENSNLNDLDGDVLNTIHDTGATVPDGNAEGEEDVSAEEEKKKSKWQVVHSRDFAGENTVYIPNVTFDCSYINASTGQIRDHQRDHAETGKAPMSEKHTSSMSDDILKLLTAVQESNSPSDELKMIASPDKKSPSFPVPELPLALKACPENDCNFEYSRFSELTYHHLVVHRSSGNFHGCDICETGFVSAKGLYNHLSMCHGPKLNGTELSCTICHHQFADTSEIKAHVKADHDSFGIAAECYRCNTCGRKLDSPTSVEIHKMKEHLRKMFPCDICGMQFTMARQLGKHIKTDHISDLSSLRCPVCSKTFPLEKYLRAHIKRHNISGKRFSCPTCGKRFHEKTTMVAHLEVHKDKSERSYRLVCSYCGQGYNSKKHFDDHLNKHTGAKPHICEYCGKRFSYRTLLYKHKIWVHNEGKPHKCPHCPMIFKTQCKVKQHLVTHTGESKHMCENCGRPFVSSTTLRKHLMRCKGSNLYRDPKTELVFIKKEVELSEMSEEEAMQHSSILQIIESSEARQDHKSMQHRNLGYSQDESVIVTPIEGFSDSALIGGAELGTSNDAAVDSDMLIYMCSDCSITFQDLEGIHAHIETCHTAENDDNDDDKPSHMIIESDPNCEENQAAINLTQLQFILAGTPNIKENS